MDRERVVVAEILRPWGLRGELVARSQTDVPQRFEQLETVNLQVAGCPTVSVKVAAAWRHKDDWVIKFDGVDSVDAAEQFRGADMWVPRAQRGALPEGEFFRSDLVGCSVVSSTNGRLVGEVKGWQQYGAATPLMEVVVEGGREQLIPFVPEASRVDLAGRTIRVDLPDGLLDL